MQLHEQDVRRPYQEPAGEKHNLKRTMRAWLGRARNALPRLRPQLEPFVDEEPPKVYEKPKLRKLTQEQANLILFGHASVGDPGARDLIEIIFREEPTQSGNR